MPASHRFVRLASVLAVTLLALPACAAARATISRHGNSIVLTGDGGEDEVSYAGTDYLHEIAFDVPHGDVLRAGAGCRRLRGPRVTKVVVSCGAPSLKENDLNHVTMRVNLGGGDDSFVADPWDDVQPRIIAEGGPGNDTISGSINADEIDGGPGNDQIYGMGGNDTIRGGDGGDTLTGGPGDDTIEGGGGGDVAIGDEGRFVRLIPGLLAEFESRPSPGWGNDTIITALDFTPDLAGFYEDVIECGEGPADSAVIDAVDYDVSCEILSGGRTTPPVDPSGTLPLTIGIGALEPPPGGVGRVRRGEPISLPVTFSAPATISATLTISAGLRRRLHLPSRVIARGIGTPLTLVPITLNTQITLLWKVRPALIRLRRLHATLTIKGTDVNGATTTARKAITVG